MRRPFDTQNSIPPDGPMASSSLPSSSEASRCGLEHEPPALRRNEASAGCIVATFLAFGFLLIIITEGRGAIKFAANDSIAVGQLRHGHRQAEAPQQGKLY